MGISSFISSLSSSASVSSVSLASSTSSSDLTNTWTPHRPLPKTSALQLKSPAVEFWYEDDDEESPTDDLERFSFTFLDECRLCKRLLGTGRDAYMCAAKEAAFCSEDCRQEWMEMEETSIGEKIRQRAMMMMNACYPSRNPASEIYNDTRYKADGALVVV